jgi:serine/threonine-protein kinase PpkA
VIEIPGYKILRQLGRGGMATVYLAMQESVQREVALKVMSPALLVDPDFGERFLREARIAAKLHHRHVVGVHDVGREGDHHYIAMEYLGGGTLLSKEGEPRPVAFALRVTREIAMALNYAHAKGFVHRDVKPDNILLRDDGSSALTDFGIARASDSATHMTRTGTVIGTPHYMSPEQARGRSLDGRADLYSLGIVLYELLTGRVPYHADDSLAVGIMHITQPVPILPEALLPLQPLLNRMLAKQPDDRYQNGAAVADAIEQVEIALARGDLPEVAQPDEAYRRQILGASTPTQARPAAGTPPQARATVATPTESLHYRAEPSLGRMDDIAAQPMRRPMGRGATPRSTNSDQPSRKGLWLALLGVLVVAGALGAWQFQGRLRALIPNTELNGLITRADKALADGKLIGTQRDSARELFEAARTLDPDNEQARQGLSKVGQKLLEQARVALTRNDLDAMKNDLDAANDVLGGGAEIEQLRADLRRAETRHSAADELLTKGAAALAAGKLIGAGSAAEAYQHVIDNDGSNAVAISGLRKVGERLVEQARAAIADGKADAANQRIAELEQLTPSHAAIPELRGEVAKLHASDSEALEKTLTKAEAQQRAGRIGGDEGALALFQTVLKKAPDNARAKTGLRKVAQTLVAQANQALNDSNTVQAEKLLQQAEAAVPDLADLRAVRSRLREAREQQDIAKQQAQISPAEQTRIATLLEEADKALIEGNLIEPPSDCAFDKYRAVLRVDKDNAKAMAGLARIPGRAKELFEQTVKDNPRKARAHLDAIAQSEPGDASLPSLRERLAGAYLDQADARLGQDRRAEAEKALKAARELSPTNPRIAPLEAKLQAQQTPATPPATTPSGG